MKTETKKVHKFEIGQDGNQCEYLLSDGTIISRSYYNSKQERYSAEFKGKLIWRATTEGIHKELEKLVNQ